MAEITGMYIALQNRLIGEYGITLCDGRCPDDGTPCKYGKSGTHRCAWFDPETKENRRIRNWEQEDTIYSTYVLLHEIGHCMAHYDIESINEYNASVFAIKKCRELGLNLPRDIVVENQRHITNVYRYNVNDLGSIYLMFGMYNLDWVKTPEDYSIVRVYDEVYGYDLQEHVRRLTERRRFENG